MKKGKNILYPVHFCVSNSPSSLGLADVPPFSHWLTCFAYPHFIPPSHWFGWGCALSNLLLHLTKLFRAHVTHHPDDGGNTLLWNIGQYPPDCVVQHHRRQPSLLTAWFMYTFSMIWLGLVHKSFVLKCKFFEDVHQSLASFMWGYLILEFQICYAMFICNLYYCTVIFFFLHDLWFHYFILGAKKGFRNPLWSFAHGGSFPRTHHLPQ
jgi:hypothetical protein